MRSMILRFWKSHRDRYPYVSRETWTTRTWLLLKKVDRQAGIVGLSDLRVAVELLRLAPKAAPAHLMQYLEEVITHGTDERPASGYYSAQEEGVGQE